MNKSIKKLLSSALALSIAASGAVLPIMASAEDEMKSWKFDFGAEGSTPEAGYTLVTPDENYMNNSGNDDQYGFLGIDENGHRLGPRLDGFDQQEGQVIQLEAGGGTGLNDGIGSVGEDEYKNAGDKYYPVRFAVKVPDETYYKIKATVTTLDTTKPAKASLYTERKHPLYTEKTIAAGEAVTTEFTIRVTPIYYEKSDPKGTAADGMINVCVLGENTALAALEITQLETAPTLWVLGDSTVTDGGGLLPFFPLQNYTGVGTGLTKYLPSNIAMVNEGEGGLNANDGNHFNMVKNRIKAGDYLYVEYGHNHKNNKLQTYTGEYWRNDYLQALKKYYEACRDAKGGTANLIVVGPIDRHNDSQYDSATNTWSSTLNGFSNIGKQYVDCLKYGGETAAAEFLAKWNAISAEAEGNKTGDRANESDELTALKAAADKIVADTVAGGTTKIANVAFVDLNQPSLDWLTTISESGTVNDQTVTNSQALTNYYFQTDKNGATDGTHPNDVGAENLAYYFFTTADDEAYPLLTPLLANFEEGAAHEEPTPVSPEIINMGAAGKTDAWPTYNPPVPFEYPTVIKDIKLNENGEFVSMDVQVQASIGAYYAVGIVEIYDAEGKKSRELLTSTHIDNSAGKGLNTLLFAEGNALAEGETYKAYVWPIDTANGELISAEDGGDYLSSIYTPTDIDKYIITGENGGVEDFNHYGQTDLTGSGKYVFGGSAGHELSLGKDNDIPYARIMSDGAKNGTAGQGSFYIMRPLENLVDDEKTNIGTGDLGKYMIDVDVMYTSGGGLNFAFCENTTPTKSPFISNEFAAFGIGNNGAVTASGKEVGTVSGTSWTNVKYILDMNSGTAEVSVAGGTPVTVDVPAYQTFSGVSVKTLKHFILEGQKVAFDVKISNLTVAKLKDSGDEASLNVSVKTAGNADASAYEVTANADKAYEDAALIIATYTNGALENVTAENKALTEGENKFEIEAPEGAKIMLWDSLSGMKPLEVTVEQKTEEETVVMGTVYIDEAGTTEKSVVKGNNVKAYAVPEEGYVFVKWTDADGKDFSTESELNIRLYKDLSLQAEFAKQKGVEGTKSYKMSADKSLVKVGKEQKVNLIVEDVFDEQNNPVKYNPETDVVWASEDKGVTVENGVVTIPADYDMGDAETKDITVKSKINDIEKTAVITLYAYEFIENVTGGTTSAPWDGAVGKLANKDCIGMPGGDGTSTLTISDPVKLGEKTLTITYKVAGGGSDNKLCGQPRCIEFYDSTGKKVINELIGYSWGTLNVGGKIKEKKDGIEGGTEFADALVLGTWNEATITINTDGTGTVAFGAATADITIAEGASDIAAIKFVSSTGAPGFNARSLGIADIKIK